MTHPDSAESMASAADSVVRAHPEELHTVGHVLKK